MTVSFLAKIVAKTSAKKPDLKSLRTQVFQQARGKLMDVRDYLQRMKKLGANSVGIDPGFVGKIDEKGAFYTTEGKKLRGTIGTDVVMNPEYKAKGGKTYYCISTPRGTKINTRQMLYTEEYANSRGKQKWGQNLEMGKRIDKIRKKLSKDLDSPDWRKRTLALIITMVDKGWFRIGNAKSELNGVYGLHNLKMQHISFLPGNKVRFNFVGKDRVVIDNTVEVPPKVYRMLKECVKGKKKDDYLFSAAPGDKNILRETSVNDYLRNDLGSGESTVHRFRHYHATKELREGLSKVKLPKNPTKKEVMDAFLKVLAPISKKLGHTKGSGDVNWSTTVKNYVDPLVVMKFFKDHNVELPKVVPTQMATTTKIAAKTETIQGEGGGEGKPKEERDFLNWMNAIPPELMEEEVPYWLKTEDDPREAAPA